MLFDDFLTWLAEAIKRMRERRIPRERWRHIQRLCRILLDADCFVPKRWDEVGRKAAKLLEEPAPARPIGEPGAVGLKAIARASRFRNGVEVLPDPVHEVKPAARPRRKAREVETIQTNTELEAAFRAVAAGKPIVFVTGGAGTGKSTFIRALREKFRDRNTIVLAPTGVAALTAGGQTIHSFCGLPLRPVVPEDIRKISDDDDNFDVVRNLDLLIVDEISMVRADVLDGLEHYLRINRESTQPFGGVQVIFVGDLFQLPPVVTRDDEPFFAERYSTPFFFGAHCLRGLGFTPVELQIVYRQSDERFKELLRNLREADDVAQSLTEINSRCLGRQLSPPYVMLVPTRKAAAAENEKRLGELPGKAMSFAAGATGTFETRGDDNLPAPRKLVLKKGAQVMFTRNDADRRWVNGTLATVERLKRDQITVRLADGAVHDVEPVTWDDIRYAFDKEKNEMVEEIAGTFEQFPLMLAWAVTIHKAQGLTLARVAVDIGHGAFADGQVYVALSRCQSLEGLSLARPIRSRDVRCSEPARAFYGKMRKRR